MIERKAPPVMSLADENGWYAQYTKELWAEIDRLNGELNDKWARQQQERENAAFERVADRHGLTKRGYSILAYLNKSDNAVPLEQMAKGIRSSPDSIKVFVSHMNRMFEQPVVESLRGVGYRITDFGRELMKDPE